MNKEQKLLLRSWVITTIEITLSIIEIIGMCLYGSENIFVNILVFVMAGWMLICAVKDMFTIFMAQKALNHFMSMKDKEGDGRDERNN